jgi:DNA-binding GntR family transcriptional regulator
MQQPRSASRGRAQPAGKVRSRAAAGGVSRAESVYARLLQDINSGELRAGDRVREMEIAESLGVSRTPVREALHRLESEGIITKSDHGLIVPLMDDSQIEALYFVREVLEGAAAGLASRHASDAQIQVLEQMLAEAATLPEEDSAQHAELNKDFHAAIYRAANNRYMLKSLQSTQDAIQRLGTTFAWPGRAPKAWREHRAIVRAIARRDPAAAEESARVHMREALRCRMLLLHKRG